MAQMTDRTQEIPVPGRSNVYAEPPGMMQGVQHALIICIFGV